MTAEATQVNVLTAEGLLKNWQGHRKLTRRTIEAFPEDKLFQFSVGGMRPFSEMAWEFIRMTGPVVEGVSSGKWQEYSGSGSKPTTKSELLQLWDAQTVELNEKFTRIPPHRFAEVEGHSDNGRLRESRPFSMQSITKYIIAGKDLCTCECSALNRRIFGSAIEFSRSHVGARPDRLSRWALGRLVELPEPDIAHRDLAGLAFDFEADQSGLVVD